MADLSSVILKPDLIQAFPEPTSAGGEPALIGLIELLFFAYRDFTSDPDEILGEFGFGRAHHRILHFVDQHPGLRVADLLDILKITKQSLARVLRQLVASGYIEQRLGDTDRRERRLYTTRQGRQLARRLLEPQIKRMRAALANAGETTRPDLVEAFFFAMIEPNERRRVELLLAETAKVAAASRRNSP